MSATTIIEQAFGPNANLYTTVLQRPSSSSSSKDGGGSKITPSQLRKAYYRQALQYHPDKQGNKSSREKNEAKLKFQAISVAYSILSNPDRKRLYDETGELDDGDDDDDDNDDNAKNSNAWKEYFKGIFGKVTTSDIDKFAESYKCSEEEEKDVLKYYKQFQGDLNKMLECVMCSEEVDKKRWVEDYILPAIEKRQVPDFREKVNDTMGHHVSDRRDNDDDDDEETVTEDESDDNHHNSKRKSSGSSKKSKAPTKKKKTSKTSTEPQVSQDLIAAIRGKGGGGGQRGLDSLLAGLEERYASKKNQRSAGKKKGMVEDIPDEEFEKIQKRLVESQRKRKK
jgi:DnaJ family protein C protein 9